MARSCAIMSGMDKSTAHTVIIVLTILGALFVGDNALRAEVSKVRDEMAEIRSEIADIRAEIAEMRGALNAHITGHQHGIAEAKVGGERQEPQN